MLGTSGHPHLVQLIGWIEVPTGIVMHRYTCSLRDVLRNRDAFPFLGLGTIAVWAREVACGLDEMHGLNVVHFDLKPLNIFMVCAARPRNGLSPLIPNHLGRRRGGLFRDEHPDLFKV